MTAPGRYTAPATHLCGTGGSVLVGMGKKLLSQLMQMPGVRGSRIRMLLAAYFLVGLVLVGVAVVLFAGHTARRMERQAALLTQVFSRFLSETVFQADRPGSFAIIRSILDEIDFPVIILMADGTPLVWQGVPVPSPQGDEPGELGGPDLTPEQLEARRTLDRLVLEFDRHNRPYPIEVGGIVQGSVHFGRSTLFRQLRWMPLVLVLAVAVFVALGLLGIRAMKTSEQRSIWVGMAKETAHQLGTPLTSLLGWVQVLESEDAPREGESAVDARERRLATYAEMQRDLGRLAKVSARFSKIGSAPNLIPVDLADVLHESVTYIKKRAPHLGRVVQIEAEVTSPLRVLGNRELIEWVFENLLKNALDALENGGAIRVQAGRDTENRVEVRIADTGRGIPSALRRRIWEPGFSTKQRGWGLGLTLVRRIVEEYHGGRIWVEDNEDRRGACFAMRFRSAD